MTLERIKNALEDRWIIKYDYQANLYLKGFSIFITLLKYVS